MTPIIHPDGIYFGMPKAEYHRDPALGSSGVCDLLVSPLKYWTGSVHNPDRVDPDEEEENEFKNLGDYLHDLLLEGGINEYAEKPKGMSFSTKAGKAWRDEQLESDKIIITPHMASTQRVMFKALKASGVLERFHGGLPEVSFFWTEKTGQRCKIRIDYLKPDESLDLKTYSNSMDWDVETAVARTVAGRRISIKAFWYDRGLRMMLEAILNNRDGRAAVTLWPKVRQWPEDESNDRGAHKLLEGLYETAANLKIRRFPLWFVFCETGDVPNITARAFESHDDGQLNAYWRWAKMGVEFATQRYAQCVAKFGFDQPWIEEVFFKEFTDADFASTNWILAKE